ncbi:MAG: hypothetical protein M3422_04110 [Actinomycetota bacterium]|nr:hypothetical protein [Actinomycetota bacterium]
MSLLGSDLAVGAYVVIRHGCPVAMAVVGNEAHVTCGTVPGNAFEFVIEEEALRAFVSLAVMALEEMARTQV